METFFRCTGGTPKALPEFEQLRDKVTLFRRLDDYFKLADVARKSESIAIIGGGFLGSELACALAAWSQQPKLEVTQIFPENGNMAKVIVQSQLVLVRSCQAYHFAICY